MKILDKMSLIASYKEDIRQAIEGKKVDMTDIPLSQYAEKIEGIEQGYTQREILEKKMEWTTIHNESVSYVSFYGLYSNSYITKLDLPNCVSISLCAFAYCSNLSEFNLPNCSYVGNYAFSNCTSLQSISLPNCSYVGDDAFAYCKNLSEVSLPNLEIIETSAFVGCYSLQSISLPNCKSIGGKTFYDCRSLTTVYMPKLNYARNGNNFSNCWRLSQLTIGTEGYRIMRYYDDLRNTSFTDGIGSIYVNAGQLSYWKNAPGWSSFSSLMVGVGDSTPFLTYSNGLVTGKTSELYNYFYSDINVSYTSITEVSLPECKILNSYAFANLGWIKTVNLPECVSVSNYAVQDLTRVEYIYMPKVTYLSNFSLSSKSYLKEVNLHNYSGQITSDFFYRCYSLQSVDLYNCTYVGESAFFCCSSLKSISLPNCSYISNAAFWYCRSLQYVDLPNCSYIGYMAFSECSSLQYVDLPNCSFISTGAFFDCYSISSISLPICTYIGEYAFIGCSRLQSVVLPKCLSLFDRTFRDCYSLQYVDLHVCSTLSYAIFYSCSALSTIILRYSGVCKLYDNDTFYYTPIRSGTGSIYVPASLVDEYKTATNWVIYSSQIYPIPE